MSLRVAVVDAHPVFRAGLKAVLHEHGEHVIVEAGDALDAYEKIDSTRPDVIVVDHGLPGANGVSVTRELLRRDPNHRILILSMRVEEDAAAEALAAGARGVLDKEQPVEQVVAAVRSVAEGRTYLPPHVSIASVEERLRRGPGGPLALLSSREREVFELLIHGFTNEAVASQLDISRRTVETHRSRILKKLRVHSAVDLIRLAARHGLLGT